MGCFQIPAYIRIAKDTSMIDIKSFCDQFGYPVVLKGAIKGAKMCLSWWEVLSQLNSCSYWTNGFLQQFVPGLECGIG